MHKQPPLSRVVIAITTALPLLLAGCQDEKFSAPASVDLVSVKLQAIDVSDIPLGLSGKVRAMAIYDDGTTKDISSEAKWSMSDEAFVKNGFTADNALRLKANAIDADNQTVVSAQYQGVTSDEITLSASDAVLSALQVTPLTASLPKGYHQPLSAVAVMSDLTTQDLTEEPGVVTWKAASACIEMDEHGVAEGISAGCETEVTATAVLAGYTAESTIALGVTDAALTQIKVEPVTDVLNHQLANGATRLFHAIGQYTDGQFRDITSQPGVNWSDRDASGDITVTPGVEVLVTGETAGEASVVASMSGVSGEFALNVFDFAPDKGMLLPAKMSNLRVGDTIALNFFALSESTGDVNLSADPDVTWLVTPKDAGEVKRNAEGLPYFVASELASDVKITATAKTGLSAESDAFDVVAADMMDMVVFPLDGSTLPYGLTQQLSAKATYSDGTQGGNALTGVSWSSVPAGLVDADGVLTLPATGDVTVTAKYNASLEQTVTYHAGSQVPSSLSIGPTEDLVVGVPQRMSISMNYLSGESQAMELGVDAGKASLTLKSFSGKEPKVTAGGYVTATDEGSFVLEAVWNDDNSVAGTVELHAEKGKSMGTLLMSPMNAQVTADTSLPLHVYQQFSDGQTPIELTNVEWTTNDVGGTGSTLVGGVFYAGTSAGMVEVTATGVDNVELVDGTMVKPTVTQTMEVVARELKELEINVPSKVLVGIAYPLKAVGRYTDNKREAYLDGDWTVTGGADFDSVAKTFTPTSTDPITLKVVSTDGAIDSESVVTADTVPVTGLSLSPVTGSSLMTGFEQTLSASLMTVGGLEYPLNAKDVTWSVAGLDVDAVSVKETDGRDSVTGQMGHAGANVTLTASYNLPVTLGGGIQSEDVTLDVVAAKVTGVTVTPSVETELVANHTYQLTAKVALENGQVHEVPHSQVTWTTSNSEVSIDNATGQMTLSPDATGNVTVTGELIHPDYVGSGLITDQTYTIVGHEIHSIFISGGDVEMEPKSTHTFHLVGAYSDTEEVVDMNGMTDVDWQLLDSAGNPAPASLGSIDKATGELTSGTDEGELTVVASYPDAGEASVKVNVVTPIDPMEYVCGHEIDNTDLENAKGACLKVATDSSGNWFTNSPSKAVMDALGYSQDATETNSGKTYAYISIKPGDGLTDPIGGVFAQFRHDGPDTEVNSQIGRWCQDLAAMSFAGKSDWQLPTKDQLIGLYNKYSGSANGLFTARGWPATNLNYWTSTVGAYQSHWKIRLSNGATGTSYDDTSMWASCVSNP